MATSDFGIAVMTTSDFGIPCYCADDYYVGSADPTGGSVTQVSVLTSVSSPMSSSSHFYVVQNRSSLQVFVLQRFITRTSAFTNVAQVDANALAEGFGDRKEYIYNSSKLTEYVREQVTATQHSFFLYANT